LSIENAAPCFDEVWSPALAAFAFESDGRSLQVRGSVTRLEERTAGKNQRLVAEWRTIIMTDASDRLLNPGQAREDLGRLKSVVVHLTSVEFD
jgi:hypothetical protein